MPKILDLLKIYFSKSTLTVDQQNQLTLDLVLLLFVAYVVGWVINIVIQFRLKARDIHVELKKQHGLRRSEVCEKVWRQIAKINLILPGEPNAVQLTIEQVKATRKFVHEHALCLPKSAQLTIDKLLDHLTVCATDFSKKNNKDYVKLLDEFRDVYNRT